MGASQNKIKTEKELVEIADELRGEGKIIATTNGSFDIFHYGHVKLLEEAKEQGDFLIVGINSDKSVKKYKGPDRPINSESARAGVIASLQSVDYVFLFDDTTPNRWLELIKPDIHCNSSEYGENCIEKPTLDKIGAGLVLIGRDENDGLSTSNIISKIKQN
jgi:rfaE bifunctional protein nucleotidyltransferase chain/domain